MLMAFPHLFPPATAISTAIASRFETHRFAMLLQDEVSDPHGEERVTQASLRSLRKLGNDARLEP
jgi:hypothetical protein